MELRPKQWVKIVVSVVYVYVYQQVGSIKYGIHDLWQVGGLLQVLQFSPPITLTATI
jgi:hypothetical protein